jgi:hypothetical protein
MAEAALPIAQPNSNRLPIIANSINEHLAAAEQATKRGLEHAIAAGMLLIEAKELVAHGQWLEWLQANCPAVGHRQAQTYMRLARHRHWLETFKNAATAHLTIAAAEALVGRPGPEWPHGLPGQLDIFGGEVLPPPAEAAVIGHVWKPPLHNERNRLRGEVSDLKWEIEQLRDKATCAVWNDEPAALLRCAVTQLLKWSNTDERKRFKIIQIIEHARRLIEALATPN